MGPLRNQKHLQSSWNKEKYNCEVAQIVMYLRRYDTACRTCVPPLSLSTKSHELNASVQVGRPGTPHHFIPISACGTLCQQKQTWEGARDTTSSSTRGRLSLTPPSKINLHARRQGDRPKCLSRPLSRAVRFLWGCATCAGWFMSEWGGL